MNICIATSSFPINSREIYHRYTDELIKTLLNENHTITILTQDKRGDKEVFHENVEIFWFPWKMAKTNVLSEISFKNLSGIISTFSLIYNGIKYSRKIKREKKIDLFICLWAIPSGFYIFANRFFFNKTPYLTWSLGSDIYKYKDNYLSRLLLNKTLKGACARFADGYELCEIVKEISNHECKFLPTYNEIDSKNFNVKVGEREDDSVRFLYVGRLSHVKGVDLLIEALNQFKNNFHTNFKCNIVGDGDLFESLNELVIKYKLENNVSFLGRITDSLKLSEIFTNADCLIIPSRSESIPIVLCEALQFNLPMIVSNVGDMGKIVNENKLGYVVSNTNAQYFSNVINDFICNPIVLDKTIIETTLNKLTFKHNSNLLLDVLNKLNHEY